MVRTIVARVFIAATVLACAKIAADGYLISFDDDRKTEVSAPERSNRMELKAARAAEVARQLAEGRASDKAGSDGLQAERRAARAQLAQADQDRAAVSDALRSTKATATTRQAELLAARQQADALAAELASSKRAAVQAAEVARQLAEGRASDKAGSDGLQAELRAARQQAATKLVPSEPQLGPKSSRGVEASGSSYDDARVILRFRSSSDKARSQATSMKMTLADLGFAAISISEDAKAAPGTRVSYFYHQDRTLAERLADGIKSSLPHRVSIPKSETPFPGTVEISIGG